MSESQILAKIKTMLQKEFPDIRIRRIHGGWAKGLQGGIINLGSSGWPDLCGYTETGRFIGIEVKDPEGKTNKKRETEQQTRIKDINDCGGIGITVTSADDCREQLKRRFIFSRRQ